MDVLIQSLAALLRIRPSFELNLRNEHGIHATSISAEKYVGTDSTHTSIFVFVYTQQKCFAAKSQDLKHAVWLAMQKFLFARSCQLCCHLITKPRLLSRDGKWCSSCELQSLFLPYQRLELQHIDCCPVCKLHLNRKRSRVVLSCGCCGHEMCIARHFYETNGQNCPSCKGLVRRYQAWRDPHVLASDLL